MLTIRKELAKIAHTQHRLEKHGKDDVTAVTIKIVYRGPNDVLAQFSKTLKESLYWLDESIQGQVVRDPGYMPNVKNPNVGPLEWKERFENKTLRIHHRVEDKHDLVFRESKVDSFYIHPMEGGTVTIELKVKTLLGSNSMDELVKLEKKEVHISLFDDEEKQGELLAA